MWHALSRSSFERFPITLWLKVTMHNPRNSRSTTHRPANPIKKRVTPRSQFPADGS